MLTSRKQRQHGTEVVTDAMLGQQQHDNFSCAHCGRNYRLKPLKVNGNVVTDPNDGVAYDRCTCCDKHVCLACMEKPCVPLLRQIERMERRRQNEAN